MTQLEMIRKYGIPHFNPHPYVRDDFCDDAIIKVCIISIHIPT